MICADSRLEVGPTCPWMRLPGPRNVVTAAAAELWMINSLRFIYILHDANGFIPEYGRPALFSSFEIFAALQRSKNLLQTIQKHGPSVRALNSPLYPNGFIQPGNVEDDFIWFGATDFDEIRI